MVDAPGPTAHRHLTAALLAKDWPRARSSLEILISVHPTRASLPFTLGSVLRNEYRTSEERNSSLLVLADKEYERALELEPTHAEAALHRATLTSELVTAGRGSLHGYESSLAIFDRALALSPGPPGAAVYSQLATYLLAEDDGRHRRLAAAADAYSSAVRLTPKDAQLHLSLGLQQHKRGLWDEAVSAYERAISLEPINGEAYALLGSLRLHRMQRLKRTEQALLAAVTARQRLERRRITDESYGAGIATATEAEVRATRQEFGQVLQLQGKLDDAKRFAAEQDASRAEAASAAWALQNELTLPMYVWRHRSNFSAVVDGGGSNGTKVHGGFLKGCGGVSSSSLDRPLVGCGGDCISRQATVELWQGCKRASGWPRRPSAQSSSVSAAVTAGPATDEGSRLHFAARWGASWEVKALIDQRHERLGTLLQPSGPLKYTPAHEAVLHADCEVMASLLNGVGNRSTSVLKALLAARDAFGRTADHLTQAVDPATAPCLIAAIRKAEKSAADDDDNEEEEEEEVLNAVKSLKGVTSAGQRWLSVRQVEDALAQAVHQVDDAIASRDKMALPAGEGVCGDEEDAWWQPPSQADKEPVPRCDIDVWEVEPSIVDGIEAGGSASDELLTLGAKFVQDAVSLNKPLLLRGLLNAQRLLKEWTRPALRERAGNEQLQVMQFESGAGGLLADSHTWRRVRLGEWLEDMRAFQTNRSASNDSWPEYIFDQSGAAGKGALAPAIHRLFPWRALLHSEAPGLYLGGNGSGNPFHYHAQTWNALVAGRKRWYLFPPNASFYSEQHPSEWLSNGRKGPDGAPPPLECEQAVGDVLFVPHLWGHGTVNLAETLGVAMPFALRVGVDYGAPLGKGRNALA